MVNKLAILDTNALENKGSYARLVGMLEILKITFPNYNVTIFHRYYNTSSKDSIEELMNHHPNVEIKNHPWYNEKKTIISTFLSFSFHYPICAMKQIFSCGNGSLFKEFDLLIDINLIEPEIFYDKKIDIINILGTLLALLSIWNSLLSKKKVIICSATIGPYNNLMLVLLAKYILNKINLITLREEYSQLYLKSIGVDKPNIVVTADLAFLMDKNEEIDRIKILRSLNINRDRVVIGICPAAIMNSNLPEELYIQLLVQFSDFLITETDAIILYIANTFQDILMVEKVYNSLNNPKNSQIIPFTNSASKTKSIIGICNLFICSRFHALVASTSIGIPSIGLVSYSYNKFHGIIGKMMGQERFLLNIDHNFEYNTFYSDLVNTSKYLLLNGQYQQKKLLKRYNYAKEQAMINGKLMYTLISKTENRR